ncbi:MAG: preprotein translocase subunit SecE [Verrucomicrobiota bacterium]|nr:preprotein translocase subunit SecE [Verrucomicrobiota bacterium]
MDFALIFGIVAFVVFAFLWYKGKLAALSRFVGETREELRKCTWPTRDELKSSTVVVLVATAVIGVLTVLTDLVVMTFLDQIL